METIDKVRDILDPSEFEDLTGFHFTEVVASMFDGVKTLAPPREMQQVFKNMWDAYANLYKLETSTALMNLLGLERFEQLVQHEDGTSISHEILDRMRKSKDEVDVTDILEQAGIM